MRLAYTTFQFEKLKWLPMAGTQVSCVEPADHKAAWTHPESDAVS